MIDGPYTCAKNHYVHVIVALRVQIWLPFFIHFFIYPHCYRSYIPQNANVKIRWNVFNLSSFHLSVTVCPLQSHLTSVYLSVGSAERSVMNRREDFNEHTFWGSPSILHICWWTKTNKYDSVEWVHIFMLHSLFVLLHWFPTAYLKRVKVGVYLKTHQLAVKCKLSWQTDILASWVQMYSWHPEG